MEKENQRIKINGVVLANPMGLYPQNFLELTKNFVITEPKIEAQETNPAVPHMSQLEFILELAKGIGQDIQATKFKYPAMFLAQMEQMRGIDPALTKLNAPVIVLTTDKDFVSNYRKYLPEEEIKKRTALPKPEDEVREWILKSEKWEHLPDEIKAKFGSKEEFVDDYLKKFSTREAMANTSRARRQYLKEHKIPQAASTEFLLATRYGSHIGIPMERSKQVAYIVSRIFDRLKRSAEK